MDLEWEAIEATIRADPKISRDDSSGGSDRAFVSSYNGDLWVLWMRWFGEDLAYYQSMEEVNGHWGPKDFHLEGLIKRGQPFTWTTNFTVLPTVTLSVGVPPPPTLPTMKRADQRGG